MADAPFASLEDARVAADLSIGALWVRYFALGGSGTPEDVGDVLAGRSHAPRYQHNVLVAALNERFQELDRDHPVPYRA